MLVEELRTSSCMHKHFREVTLRPADGSKVKPNDVILLKPGRTGARCSTPTSC